MTKWKNIIPDLEEDKGIDGGDKYSQVTGWPAPLRTRVLGPASSIYQSDAAEKWWGQVFL